MHKKPMWSSLKGSSCLTERDLGVGWSGTLLVCKCLYDRGWYKTLFEIILKDNQNAGLKQCGTRLPTTRLTMMFKL